MKRAGFLFIVILLNCFSGFASDNEKQLKLFKGDNSHIRYVGRVDFSHRHIPRLWAPGVYLEAKFKGNRCQILVSDEAAGSNHNYLEIIIDGKNPYRIKLKSKINTINLPDSLTGSEHVVMICKDTESNIGYIDVVGIMCEKLLPPPAKPAHKIEYFGDSITSGTGMDLSVVPCDKGQWYDQHNAYMSYGAQTSRNLDAEWQLTALAGVGLIHSCCNMKVVMPQIYDKVFLAKDTISWNFRHYRPDVVTICLGQNDGPQDSTMFCNAYVKLINGIRKHYPKADIICLTSPMANKQLTATLKNYLTGITSYLNRAGDKKVHEYFFSRQYHNGCGGHPDMAEHKLIAGELTACIKQLKGW